MKFTEMAIIILMITLSISAIETLGIIPSGENSNNLAYSTKGIGTYKDSFKTVNGSIICSNESKKDDVYCKIEYLNMTKYATSGLTDTSSLLDLSDVIRGVTILSDTLFAATFRAGDLFDYFIDECNEWYRDPVTEQLSCVVRNPIYNIRYFILFPLTLVYLMLLFYVLTGKDISGDK